MNAEIAEKLLKLNQTFYAQFAMPFADSRSSPQPGFFRLLEYLPSPCKQVLDVGCGNGRFGHFLETEGFSVDYTGVDFTKELLALAAKEVKGNFYQREISHPGFLEATGNFDLIACLATMQHVPARASRIAMLREMKQHLVANGHIFLSNWQFLASHRQRRKIRDWSDLGLSEADTETGDYLLTWRREGNGLRYVCAIDAAETAELAKAAGLRVMTHFRSDGREGDLNLYTILTHDIRHQMNEEFHSLPVDRSDANATI